MEGHEQAPDPGSTTAARGGGERSLRPAEAAQLELARVRSLAAIAGTLVHDLSNHLNNCLALAVHSRPQLQDRAEIKLHDDLCRGVQSGAQLARALGRALSAGSGAKVVVSAAQLLDDALAVADKTARQNGVELRVVRPAVMPSLRTVAADASHALWLGLSAAIAAGARRLELALVAVDLPLAGGRMRPCVRISVLAVGLPAAAADEVAAALAGAGSLAIREGLDRGALVQAAVVQRVLGGDLVATARGEGLELAYVWPALG